MKTPIFTSKTALLFLSSVVVLVFTACGCTKNTPQDTLPPITQTGANTFGCLINGKVFIPKDYKGWYPPGSNPKGLESYLKDNHTLIIDAGNLKDKKGNRIYIYMI